MIKIFSNDEQKVFLEYVEKELVKFIEQGYNMFIVEYNIDVDLSVIDFLIELRQKYPQFLLVAMIWGVDFIGFWSTQEQIKYFHNLNKIDNFFVLPNFGNKQTSDNCYYALPNIMAMQNSENEDFKEPIIISLEEIAIRLKNAL